MEKVLFHHLAEGESAHARPTAGVEPSASHRSLLASSFARRGGFRMPGGVGSRVSFTTQKRALSRVLNGAILFIVCLIGIAAFLYPFFQPRIQASTTMDAHGQNAPLMFMILIVLSLGMIMGNIVGSGSLNAKAVAMLGVLTAVNAVLRALPGPSGFSPMFVLPILTGYCYGPAFGFLLGALSLTVSALLGAGIGPWMSYQMFAVGWVGGGLWPGLWVCDKHLVLALCV
jgi:hypothetical protein